MRRQDIFGETVKKNWTRMVYPRFDLKNRKKEPFSKAGFCFTKTLFCNKMFFFFLTQLRIELCASIAERENKWTVAFVCLRLRNEYINNGREVRSSCGSPLPCRLFRCLCCCFCWMLVVWTFTLFTGLAWYFLSLWNTFFFPSGVTSFTCLSVRAGVWFGFFVTFFFFSIQPDEVNIAKTVPKRTQLWESACQAIHGRLAEDGKDFLSSFNVEQIHETIVARDEKELRKFSRRHTRQRPRQLLVGVQIMLQLHTELVHHDGALTASIDGTPNFDQLLIIADDPFAVVGVVAAEHDSLVTREHKLTFAGCRRPHTERLVRARRDN